MRMFSVVGLVLLLASTAAAADLSGTWSGTFVITAPDGRVKNDTALMKLEQRGAEITGTAGANASEQWQIQNGRIDGAHVTFALTANGETLTFDLALVDGHLKGTAKGGAGSSLPEAALDLQRSGGSGDDLTRTVAALDAEVFDAYNRCDLDKFGSFFADDVEFYHDKGGVTRSRQSLVESVKNNICGKVRRELVPGTLEVYPIANYGAVEIGSHRFYETAGARPNEPAGVARFVHLWQFKDGAWKITRVISYDHGPAPK
jgi:hypothetical protein